MPSHLFEHAVYSLSHSLLQFAKDVCARLAANTKKHTVKKFFITPPLYLKSLAVS